MKLKKTLCVILAVVLCITATIVVVTANTKEASIQILSEKSQIAAGESTTISVKVTTNFPVATMSIPIFYDKTMVSVSDATATLTDYSVKSTTTDAQSVNSSKVYANTNISEDNYGFVLVTYIGSAGANVAASIDEVVLTFKITAKTDVTGEAVVKCIAESAKTTDNIAGMLYFGSPVSGNTIDSVPENVEKIDFTSASQTIIILDSSKPSTLIVEEGFEYADYVVIDTNNNNYDEYTGIVYGIDTLEQNDAMEILGTLDDALTTNNGDDYLVISANENAGVESTDAIIEVIDENGDVLETYVFVYFGDPDGDGYITISDAFMAEYYEATYEGIESYASYVAADVDVDGAVTISDAFVMEYYEAAYEGVDYQYNLAQVAVDNTYEWIY